MIIAGFFSTIFEILIPEFKRGYAWCEQVFLALEELKKADAPLEADLLPVEKLISEAYKIIDKSAKVGTIHPNKAANRKSRLARAKRAVVMTLGWYTPAPVEASAVAA